MARLRMVKTRYPGVYRREDGRFVVRVKVVHPRTGRSRERSQVLDPGETLTAARRKAEELRAEAQDDSRPLLIPTVADYSERYVRRKVESEEWTPGSNTIPNNVGVYANHVLPILGPLGLDELTVADLRAWMDAMRDTGAKPGALKSRWDLCRALLRSGFVEYGLPDITQAVRAPKVKRKGGADMTLMPQQAAHFIAHVQDNEPNWYSLTLLGFATGARPSELLCAQVGDLDLEREVGVWRITRHWGVDGTILPGTKTSDGEIVPVDLDPGTTVALREHLAEKTASEWLTAGYKGRPPGRNAIRQFLRRVRTALGLESTVTGKVFRQTNITLSRMAGIADVIVMSQHGHSSLQMTETYTRIPSEAREAAARKFGNVIPLPLKVGTEVGTGSEPESDAG